MTNWTIFSSDSIFEFGTHRGRTIEEVMSNQASYIIWCIKEIDYFLIDIDLLESFVGKYDTFIEDYDSKEKRNILRNVNPFNFNDEVKNIMIEKWAKFNKLKNTPF